MGGSLNIPHTNVVKLCKATSTEIDPKSYQKMMDDITDIKLSIVAMTLLLGLDMMILHHLIYVCRHYLLVEKNMLAPLGQTTIQSLYMLDLVHSDILIK